MIARTRGNRLPRIRCQLAAFSGTRTSGEWSCDRHSSDLRVRHPAEAANRGALPSLQAAVGLSPPPTRRYVWTTRARPRQTLSADSRRHWPYLFATSPTERLATGTDPFSIRVGRERAEPAYKYGSAILSAKFQERSTFRKPHPPHSSIAVLEPLCPKIFWGPISRQCVTVRQPTSCGAPSPRTAIIAEVLDGTRTQVSGVVGTSSRALATKRVEGPRVRGT